MIFGTCKLHTAASNVMQILCKFCHNKHFNTLDGATYDQHDCHRHTTWKKSYVALLQIVHLLQRLQQTTMLEYRCRQLVELRVQYVHHSPGWYCHQWTSVTVHDCAPLQQDRLLQLFHVSNFLPWYTTRATAGLPKWHNPPGLSPGCWVATRNALITILSSRVISPIKMHKHGYYSTVLFL